TLTVDAKWTQPARPWERPTDRRGGRRPTPKAASGPALRRDPARVEGRRREPAPHHRSEPPRAHARASSSWAPFQVESHPAGDSPSPAPLRRSCGATPSPDQPGRPARKGTQTQGSRATASTTRTNATPPRGDVRPPPAGAPWPGEQRRAPVPRVPACTAAGAEARGGPVPAVRPRGRPSCPPRRERRGAAATGAGPEPGLEPGARLRCVPPAPARPSDAVSVV